MNRQWSDERLDGGQSLERRRAKALRPVVAGADWLLDLHSMHEPGEALLLTGMQPRNRGLARELAAPAHVVMDAGHSDGVRLRDYGRLGQPDDAAPDTRSLLVECGFHGDAGSIVVARDVCARFLELSGCLDGHDLATLLPRWRQPPAPRQWALHVTGAVVARSARFRFVQPFVGLEVIARAGTVIGDNDGEPVTTPYDDCVLVMPSTRQARQGVTVVRFARREPL